MEEDSVKLQNDRFAKSAKLYFGSLMPFNDKILKEVWSKYIDKIDISKDQAFISKDDIHRELFVTLLSLMAKAKHRKASFNKVTLNQLVDYNFSPERKTTPRYLDGDVLLIVHATPTKENKIYGPTLDQVIEERRTYGKRTYLYYKGIVSQYKGLKSLSLTDIVDLNPQNRVSGNNEVIL